MLTTRDTEATDTPASLATSCTLTVPARRDSGVDILLAMLKQLFPVTGLSQYDDLYLSVN
jgi:hypothetical protein